MRRPLNPEVVLRWASLGIGLFLVVRPDLILKSAQALTPLAQTLFPNSPWGQVIVVLGATLLPMQGGVLFLITAWGLGKGSRWARWTGLAACLCLLPGLPWFTLLGTVGAVLIFTIPIKASLQAMPPAPPEAVNDYWTAARNSKAQKIILFLLRNSPHSRSSCRHLACPSNPPPRMEARLDMVAMGICSCIGQHCNPRTRACLHGLC